MWRQTNVSLKLPPLAGAPQAAQAPAALAQCAAAGAAAAAPRGAPAASPSAAGAGPQRLARPWACTAGGQEARRCEDGKGAAQQYSMGVVSRGASIWGACRGTTAASTCTTAAHAHPSCAPLCGVLAPAALHEVAQRGRAVCLQLGALLVLRDLQDDLHGGQTRVQLLAAGHNLPHCEGGRARGSKGAG